MTNKHEFESIINETHAFESKINNQHSFFSTIINSRIYEIIVDGFSSNNSLFVLSILHIIL